MVKIEFQKLYIHTNSKICIVLGFYTPGSDEVKY